MLMAFALGALSMFVTVLVAGVAFLYFADGAAERSQMGLGGNDD